VIEAHARDADVDAPHLAAVIRLRRQPIDVIAGELAGVRDAEPELQLGVDARHEVKAERADLVVAVRLDDDRALGEPVQRHEMLERARAVHLAAGRARDRGDIERVIEVRVADEHRIGAIDPARDRGLRRRHDAPAHQVTE
jgi:hypothetical protein